MTLWLDPFRVDVHRTDGSVVVESAPDSEGRYWTYATLNDAWTTRRRIGRDDAIYGLGEKGGHHNRRGRDFTMWNTDVLNEHATAEFRAGLDADDPRADMTSTEFDPYYVTIPFFYQRDADDRRRGRLVRRQRLPGGVRVQPRRRVPRHLPRRAVDGVRLRRPVDGEHPRALHVADRPCVAASDLGARLPPVPLARLLAGGRRAHRASATATTSSPATRMWLDIDYMDGYRVFTWDSARFPDPAGMLKGLANQGFRTISIVDPGVKHDPGYAVYDDGLEQDVFCRTEGGDTYIGQVWPGNTAFPDFATPEARSWWGALNAKHVESGLAGIWNDMNEPATGEIAPQAMLFDKGRAKHERYHNQYALLMAMGTHRGPARRPTRGADLHPVAGRVRRHPALRRELDGRQPGPLGPPVGQHADGVRLRPVGPALRRRRHRRLPGRHEPGALPALDADGRR